ncbi:MAG: hypothetical protein K6C13_15515 [Oscillospiraceae bacterium]|nr:hypothetical protein [Oscillospiraceae bacterium]
MVKIDSKNTDISLFGEKTLYGLLYNLCHDLSEARNNHNKYKQLLADLPINDLIVSVASTHKLYYIVRNKTEFNNIDYDILIRHLKAHEEEKLLLSDKGIDIIFKNKDLTIYIGQYY